MSLSSHSITTESRPHFAHLLAQCAPLAPLRTAVICPEEKTALEGALEAFQEKLIIPILVGHRQRIEQTARDNNLDITGLEIVEADGEKQAAHRGVDIVASGDCQAIMKGHIHSDTYLSAIIRKENGLRSKSRTSHCFVMDIPGWHKPLIITDAALNIAPDEKNKIAITQNALHLAHAMGIKQPKAALLSAVESANPSIGSSMEAHNIAQFFKQNPPEDALIDGPFALDNAVSEKAAALKGISSPVAGNSDILVVPTIEAGNIFFKALVYLAKAETAGLVVGAKAPVILTSRADSAEARIASCALAVIYAHYLQQFDSE